MCSIPGWNIFQFVKSTGNILPQGQRLTSSCFAGVIERLEFDARIDYDGKSLCAEEESFYIWNLRPHHTYTQFTVPQILLIRRRNTLVPPGGNPSWRRHKSWEPAADSAQVSGTRPMGAALIVRLEPMRLGGFGWNPILRPLGLQM